MQYPIQILNNPTLFVTSVITMLIDTYGTDCLNWETETFEIELTNSGVLVNNMLMDKIMTGVIILTTNEVHRSVTAFNNIIQVLNFNEAIPRTFIEPSLDDILWGCLEIRMLEGVEDYEKQGFDDNIKSMILTVLKEHGITDPPSILDFIDFDIKFIKRLDEALSNLKNNDYAERQSQLKNTLNDDLKNKANSLMSQIRLLPLQNRQKSSK